VKKLQKKQSNEPFCLEKWLATSAKACLTGNEKKRKRIERREVCERDFFQHRSALTCPSPSW